MSLVNNKEKHEGIEIYSRNFIIHFRKYDEQNSLNINAFEMSAKNEEFGINQVIKIEKQIYKTPIVQKESHRYSLN